MASIVKIKRSSVQGKAPTSLEAGELALNTRDGKLFSSDGSVVFEVGANTTTLNVGTLIVGNNDTFTLPTTDGSSGQVLKTDDNGNVSWQNDSSGGNGIFPFYNKSGEQDTIPIVTGFFPFYDKSGNLDQISV